MRLLTLLSLSATFLLAGCDQGLPVAPAPAKDMKEEIAPVQTQVPKAPEPISEPVAPTVPEPAAEDVDPPALAALRRDMPADVSDFIRRAVICNHWAGEEPYDEDRRVQIAAAVESLRCRGLDTDQVALRAQYKGNVEVLRRINQSRRTPL